MLQGSCIDSATCVDSGFVDIKEVVSVGEVKEEEPDGSEDED